MIPGEVFVQSGEIEINTGRPVIELARETARIARILRGVGGGSVNSSRGSSVGSSGYGGRRAEAYRPGAAAEALAGGATSRYNDVSPPRRGYR